MVRMFFIVLIMGSCNAQTPDLKTNKDTNTLLWQVSGKGLKHNTYLFGTFHLMCKIDIHLGKNLKKAIKGSKTVYMELDLDDPGMLFNSLALMSMKDGKKLKDLYNEADYKKLQTYFNDSVGMPLDLLQTMKPMLISALIYPKMLPCKNTGSVEDEIMKLAKENKLEIKGLETMAYQASIFDSIPYKDQANDLLRSIDSIEKYKAYFMNMVDIYKRQQVKGLEAIINDTAFNLEGHSDVLLGNRNLNWVRQLKDIMNKQSVFVAVGAGHLIGPKGLIALLKKEGYKVTPIENINN